MSNLDPTCVICGKLRGDIFTLELREDAGNADTAYTKQICGSCWDVIAEIAHRRLFDILNEQERKIARLQSQVRIVGSAVGHNFPDE